MKFFWGLLTAFCVIFFFGAFTKKNANFPFKCSGFTHYDMSNNDHSSFDFFISQDIRLQSEKEGNIVFNGTVREKNNNYHLSRILILNNGKKIDNDTFHYNISEIKKSPTDDTLPEHFEVLMNEFTSDPTSLSLDIKNIGGKTYIIGGPVSYTSACVRY